MRALRKSDIIPLVSEEMGLSENTVKAAVDCFWEEIISSVRSMKHLNVNIPEIGEMRVARSKIEKAENNIKKVLPDLDPDSLRHANLSRKLERLASLKELRQMEYDKRSEVLNRRKKHDEAG